MKMHWMLSYVYSLALNDYHPSLAMYSGCFVFIYCRLKHIQVVERQSMNFNYNIGQGRNGIAQTDQNRIFDLATLSNLAKP